MSIPLFKMKSNSHFVICFLIHVLLNPVYSAVSKDEDQCSKATTCGECIRLPANCAWCLNDDMKMTRRCRPASETCPGNVAPVNPVPNYVVHDKVKRSIYQMKPQKASLTNLRIGQPYNITVQYTVARNYPVDLYYLMDVSHSMNKHKDTLVQIAETLVSTMLNLTNDLRMGFGSFVDKNAVPFIDRPYHPSACAPSVDYTCHETYLFQNQQPLSANVTEFKKKVEKTPIVLTYDDPEGGLEAFVQAMVCQSHIGWRNQARRLVVFATDANSHLAGNGRLAGIVHPNDGLCHLNGTGFYDKALMQDYPSLGQVARLAKENAINTIFAVTQNVSATYAAFSKVIPAADYGVVVEDASDIVDLIYKKYEKMASTVEMKDTSAKGIKTRYFSRCSQSVMKETNKCENLKLEETVEFIISIEATECPSAVQTIEVYPAGVNETFKLNVQVACDCQCEMPGNPGFSQNDTATCNGGGDLTCGVCRCDGAHSGQFCECSGSTDHLNLDEFCKQNANSDVLCSGRGECVCGKCVCDSLSNPSETISGTFCECDNFSCPRTNGSVCSNHGQCVCGTCQCESGYQGLACDCRTSNDQCTPPSGAECSGNGFCDCGTCQCKLEASGKYCQVCPTCPSRCDEYEPCVQCKIFNTGPYMANGQEQCKRLCDYSIVVVPTVQAQESYERECRFKNASNCEIVFVYSVDPETGLKSVRVQQEAICPPPAPLLAIGLGLLGAIILAGLALIVLFKVLTYLYDRREYARFLEDSKNWQNHAESNPLYREVTSTFHNPAYAMKKDS